MTMKLPRQLNNSTGMKSGSQPRTSIVSSKAAQCAQRHQRTRLPFIRRQSLRVQTRVLLTLLLLALLSIFFFLWLGSKHYIHASLQAHISSDLVMHSQRIGKAVPNAIQGNRDAFDQLSESRRELNQGLNILRLGGEYQGNVIRKPVAEMQKVLVDVHQVWTHTDTAADTILALQPELTSFGDMLARLRVLSTELLRLSEQISVVKSQNASSPKETAAAAQLVLLALRLRAGLQVFPKSAEVNTETAFFSEEHINAFRAAVDILRHGSDVHSVNSARDDTTQSKVNELINVFEMYQPLAGEALAHLEHVMLAKQAEHLIVLENENLKQHLTVLQNNYRRVQESRSWTFWVMLASMLVALASGIGTAWVQLHGSRRNAQEAEARRKEAEAQRLHAQQQEERAMRTNAINQAAILRLMTELQKVADGDLTVHTTVSEDITGAIADSVNFTVEALRGLVSQVTHTASQVAAASDHVRKNTQELTSAGKNQARRIHDTGQAMLDMSAQITNVSLSANRSADVARHSVFVAERGAKAVEDAVAGMTEIREQIQETSKRIKRLGESSQEIGEITELISDITEQTNVLALNAAIQAASAGEAGRGFSVVAEEVQRLAERSSAATRQIGALVRMIQTDTHDAVAAMEKSTAGVVEGAKLSDAAGASLADIRRVSNELAELIRDISVSAGDQATSANSVAQHIQSILSENEIIEQRREEVLSLFNELHDLAELLKNSVTRFRVTLS